MKLLHAFWAAALVSTASAAKVKSEGNHSLRAAQNPFGNAFADLIGEDEDLDLSGGLPSFYHTSDGIHTELKELADSCAGMTLKTRSKSSKDGDRTMHLDVVTIKAQGAEPKNKAFLLFGEHSRELISAESGLHFVKTLCSDDARSRKTLANSEFMIVVNANPDSRRQVEKGDWCVRMNPNGVDLNRNWDEHWNAFQDDNLGQTDTSPGSAPFSELETQMLKEFVQDYEPTSFITIHSGTLGMYMPWAFDMKHLADRNQESMMQILKEVDKDHCECPFGAAGKEVGYSCPGTCLDYVFDKLKTPYAFAYEIYVGSGRENLKEIWTRKMASEKGSHIQRHGHLAHDHFKELFTDFPSSFIQLKQQQQTEEMSGRQCFDLYNPSTKSEYEETVDNWSKAYLDTADQVAKRL